jgi:hypothetical protein
MRLPVAPRIVRAVRALDPHRILAVGAEAERPEEPRPRDFRVYLRIILAPFHLEDLAIVTAAELRRVADRLVPCLHVRAADECLGRERAVGTRGEVERPHVADPRVELTAHPDLAAPDVLRTRLRPAPVFGVRPRRGACAECGDEEDDDEGSMHDAGVLRGDAERGNPVVVATEVPSR